MSNGVIKTEKEAREFLGLPKTGVLDKATVDAAYSKFFREYQGKLNSWVVMADYEKWSKSLLLLDEARKICLGIRTPQAQTAPQNAGHSTGAPWSGTPQTNTRPRRRRTTSSGGVQNAAGRFGDVFVHLWLALKNLFSFLRAIPGAFAEVKDFICDVLDQLHGAGIPKIAVVMVLILGFLPLIKGCAEVIHKMAAWFK